MSETTTTTTTAPEAWTTYTVTLTNGETLTARYLPTLCWKVAGSQRVLQCTEIETWTPATA